jgi:hypothetical protein
MTPKIRCCKYCGEEIVEINGSWWNNKGNSDYPTQCFSPKAGPEQKHDPNPKCSFDPRIIGGAVGTFHCPECGRLVVAGVEHPIEGGEELPNEMLISLLPETMDKVQNQLLEDGKRWGDTWRNRPIEGQEERIFAQFRNYYDQWKHGGKKIPWEKIIGNAHIAMVREAHPELLIPAEDKDVRSK